MKHLTTELKKFYMDDFNNNVIPCTHEYWGLDKGLKEILININKSQSIQTLYSKKCVSLEIDFPESYIIFALTEPTIKKLDSIVEVFKNKYDGFTFNASEPTTENPIANGEYGSEAQKLNSLSNINHFNIKHYVFHLEDFDLNIHVNFWNDLNKFLSKL